MLSLQPSAISLTSYHVSTFSFSLLFPELFCNRLQSCCFCNKKTTFSHNLTMVPAVLQLFSDLDAAREEAAHFDMGWINARVDGWHGHGAAPAPRLAAASLRDCWLLLPFPSSSDGFSPPCLGSAFHNNLGNVIISQTISACQIWLK